MDEHKLPSADLYILSQIIHDWRSDQADFILDKVYKALLPGRSHSVVQDRRTNQFATVMSLRRS